MSHESLAIGSSATKRLSKCRKYSGWAIFSLFVLYLLAFMISVMQGLGGFSRSLVQSDCLAVPGSCQAYLEAPLPLGPFWAVVEFIVNVPWLFMGVGVLWLFGFAYGRVMCRRVYA